MILRSPPNHVAEPCCSQRTPRAILPFVQTLRFVFEHSGRDLNLRALEDCDSAPSDARIGIHASDYDALDARRGQRVDAWRRLSKMGARLERYVCSRAASERARIGKRLRFAVRTPSPARDAAPDDFLAAHDYASYRRIWSGQAQAVARERERRAHEALVPGRGLIERPPAERYPPPRTRGGGRV